MYFVRSEKVVMFVHRECLRCERWVCLGLQSSNVFAFVVRPLLAHVIGVIIRSSLRNPTTSHLGMERAREKMTSSRNEFLFEV